MILWKMKKLSLFIYTLCFPLAFLNPKPPDLHQLTKWKASIFPIEFRDSASNCLRQSLNRLRCNSPTADQDRLRLGFCLKIWNHVVDVHIYAIHKQQLDRFVIFMFTTPSSDATAMAWNWVIQSIAKFKQVDSSTLAGLVEKAPAISVDLGKDAKEMVSLRMLESLFLQGNEATVDADSAQNAKISFDTSEHCEDILHKILEETSEPMTVLERRKWNIHPFIIHKRASLPKTPVQKFKEALLEGRHPVLESLKEMSKLGGAKVSENTIPEVDVCFNAQTTVSKDDVVFLETENERSKLQESPLQKSDHVEESDRGITGDIGRKEHEMTIEPQIKDVEENTSMDHVEHIISKNLEHSCDHDNIDHGQQQPPGDDDDYYDDDERTDIAAKKEAFLSSQCMLSQDFMSTVDFTEIFLCMKCSKGGQLLVCSSDACPFRVHESCLGSASTSDGNETFFCPFCSYSHAISKYLEVKKKASLARKDLQAFLCSGDKHRPKISSKTGACLDENTSTQTGEMGEKFKLNGNEHAMNSGKDCAPANSLHQPTRQAGMAKQLSKEKESPMSSTCSPSKRICKQEPQYTSPTITLPRRRNLFWDKSEEDMLKEGVQRFSCADDKRIPWKKILEFGRDVFDKSRTAIDLKDKWRNICKETPAIKKQKL
ncbi:hypothetical protein L1987_64221 [Smallanthus sonchifolius]|uniref:Uncharacterized protein n=1 Tax=Smallanthus sonchifolius TaxID=185202 RepID=A0ACB9CFD9_9ASTR|nr:hypothetical protein L1987_64221 [Smallanthus sonchifolius]